MFEFLHNYFAYSTTSIILLIGWGFIFLYVGLGTIVIDLLEKWRKRKDELAGN